jgi:dihydrodipicolinate synthase/N-acetylneuraminate lyase
LSHSEALRRALANVVVAPVTPFDEHAEVDLNRLRQHASHLVDNGVTSILGGAHVSEFFSLTCEEWQTSTEALVEGADGRASVIAAISYHTPRRLSRWGKRQRLRAPRP